MTKLLPNPYVFFSYSHKDKDAAFYLRDLLGEHDIPLWFDSFRLKGGDWIGSTIKSGILGCSAFLVLMSENSSGASYVQSEVSIAYNAALKRELQGQKPMTIIGVLLGGETFPEVVGRVEYCWDRGGESFDSDGVLKDLRGLTKPKASSEPSHRGTSQPGPSTSMVLSGARRGIGQYVGLTRELRLRTDGSEDEQVLVADDSIERIDLSPDGSLVAVQADGAITLAEVRLDGGLSLWPSTLGMDDQKKSPALPKGDLLSVSRSHSLLDPCAVLLLADGSTTTRVRIDRNGRFRNSAAVHGSTVTAAAAVGRGFIVVLEDGTLLPIQTPIESHLPRRGWIDIDAASNGAVEVAAALRDDGGDRQLIAWRTAADGSVELRGLDLDVEARRVNVVRPRDGEEPQHVRVFSATHELGWRWEDLARLDASDLTVGDAA